MAPFAWKVSGVVVRRAPVAKACPKVVAAAARPDVPSAQGTLTEALAWEQGLPAPRWYEGNDIAKANSWFAERVLKEKPAQ